MAKSRRKIHKASRRPASTVHGGQNEELAEVRGMLAAAGAPPELLAALDNDPELLGMITAGLPSPEDALNGILSQWTGLLGPDAPHVEAETCGADFLGMLRAGALDEADLPDMLAEMIKQAEATRRPEAVAMLRVLAVLGPEEVRPSAAGAADRLVQGGLADPAWVTGLGEPIPGTGFGYTDPFGAQEALVLTFRYGQRRHGVCVLIDHDLGGGIKDCFLTDRITVLKTKYRQAARAMGVELHDYQPAQVREIVEQALTKDPCPMAPDQIEDVRAYLDLLRNRIALLPSATPTRAAAPGKSSPRTVHRLKITLRGSKPPIWRRLEVPSDISLARLHDVVQAAFGWESCHMWVFETERGDYGLPDPELGHRDAAARNLRSVTARAGDRLRYTYDFGDDWQHDITVEDVIPAGPGVAYPRCLTGRRAGPPEDCGGIWGYEELCATLADPARPQHQEMLDWLGLESGRDFDPASFDLAAVNKALSELATVIR